MWRAAFNAGSPGVRGTTAAETARAEQVIQVKELSIVDEYQARVRKEMAGDEGRNGVEAKERIEKTEKERQEKQSFEER